MKKVSVLLLVIFLAACNLPGKEGGQPVNTHFKPENIFVCEDNSKVIVSYSEDGEVAYVQLRMPQVQLDTQAIELKRAVSGSGARYINELSPEIRYEWHANVYEGIMSIHWNNGKKYSTVCKLQ